MGQKSNVEQLNSFLRGEISAVETYRMALEKLDKGSVARSDIEANMQSHQARVTMLTDAIRQLGGEPVDGSGPWGAFAKVVEGTARVFGDKVAVAALEEGEDHGLKDYKADMNELDLGARTLVTSQLLPQQQQTHDRLSALKKRLASA